MNEPRRGTLGRLLDGGRDALRDIAIVVLSILIAFGLDAWWDHRIDRRDARDALANLRDEFSYNRTTLLAAMERRRATRAAALELLRRATSDERLTTEETNSLLFRMMVTGTYDPAVGTVTALLSSPSGGWLPPQTSSPILRPSPAPKIPARPCEPFGPTAISTT